MTRDQRLEKLHERMNYLQEVADGAHGDNPMVRGLARDEATRVGAELAALETADGATR